MNKYVIEFINLTGRVIIPDFGCLSISDEGKVVFNTFINFDDGKLSAYICEQSGAEPQDVINKISAWAREIQAKVNKGEDFELVGLGKFYKTGPDEMDFKAVNANGSENIEENIPEIIVEQDIVDEQTIVSISEEVPEIIEESVAPQSSVESVDEVIDLEEKSESKHAKNIYIPPILTDNKDILSEKSASLDDVLKPLNQGEQSAEKQESNEEVLPVKVSDLQSANNSEIENSPKKSQDFATSSKEEAQQEVKEVTVKRKKSIFFYINVLLLLLIIAISIFAFIYTDELSKWLGITTENVISEKENKVQGNDAAELNENDTLANLNEVDSTSSQNIESTELVETPIEQTEPENIPAIAATGNFHIIVGTFSLKENADRLVKKIRDAGYDGKILKSSASGFTVSFHAFNSFEEAGNNISKAKEITGTSAYVLKQ